MFEFSVSRDMKNKDVIREVAVGKAPTHLCLTLIVKELKINAEHSRMVTTLNILFSVLLLTNSIVSTINGRDTLTV